MTKIGLSGHEVMQTTVRQPSAVPVGPFQSLQLPLGPSPHVSATDRVASCCRLYWGGLAPRQTPTRPGAKIPAPGQNLIFELTAVNST